MTLENSLEQLCLNVLLNVSQEKLKVYTSKSDFLSISL